MSIASSMKSECKVLCRRGARLFPFGFDEIIERLKVVVCAVAARTTTTIARFSLALLQRKPFAAKKPWAATAIASAHFSTV